MNINLHAEAQSQPHKWETSDMYQQYMWTEAWACSRVCVWMVNKDKSNTVQQTCTSSEDCALNSFPGCIYDICTVRGVYFTLTGVWWSSVLCVVLCDRNRILSRRREKWGMFNGQQRAALYMWWLMSTDVNITVHAVKLDLTNIRYLCVLCTWWKTSLTKFTLSLVDSRIACTMS